MSIADKLLTIAENEPKVYEAGKLALLENSKYMNITKSGAEIVVNDCSSVEHDLKVKVEALNVSTDNMFTTPYTVSYENDNGMTYKSNGESISISGNATNTPNGVAINGNFDFSKLVHGTTYYLGLIYVKGDKTANPLSFGFYCYDSNGNGTNGQNSVVWNSAFYFHHFVMMGGMTDVNNKPINYDCEVIPVLSTAPLGSEDIGEIVLSDVSITLTGTNAETKTVKANADGTVEGLKSSYPDFTLKSDTKNTRITCSYYRDIDLFIDNAISGINSELASLTDVDEE